MKTSQFTIPDIQIGVGDEEFQKGLKLYEKMSVGRLREDGLGVSTVVKGTQPYHVRVSYVAYDRGSCDCYIGQRDELCKHMVAVAIAMVYKYRPDNTTQINQPLDRAVCSGSVRAISDLEIIEFKRELKSALSCIKGYNGPSATWFEYQDSLTKGSRLILLAVGKLPVCEASVLLCIDTLKKLDKKVLGNVDDSDGRVGGTMTELVELLNMFVTAEPSLKDFITKKLPKGESFDWEAGFSVSI